MSIYLIGTKSYWLILTIIFLRYVVIAGVAYLIFYVFKRNSWAFKRIQQKFPANKDLLREIGYSIVTAIIFASVGYAIFLTPVRDYTQVYFNIEEYSTAYFVFSIIAIILVHDTYFYWMHRMIHHPSMYRLVHRTHHLSTNPSPWAAMAFHPIESFFEAGIIIIVAFLFPVHPLAIGIFLLFMMLYNVYGHLGYELYPKGFANSFIGRWVNTSVNHNQHHQYFKGNYGLYFLFWDRWMGTIREDYEKQFEVIKSKKKE